MKTVEYGRENREVILLLHGGGLSWWNFRSAAERLAGRYHVVLPILDGHAGSGVPFTTIESNAEEILDHIDRHFAGQVLLIGGLSLGGQILVEMLSRRRDVCRFALIESALALPMRLTAALIRPAYDLCYPLIRQKWFAQLQFRSLRIRRELFSDYYRDTAAIAKADMTAFLRANSDYRLKDALAGCTARVLVVVGSREQPIMLKSARMIAARLPSAELEILRGYHHGAFSLNHPDEFADRLLSLAEG